MDAYAGEKLPCFNSTTLNNWLTFKMAALVRTSDDITNAFTFFVDIYCYHVINKLSVSKR